MCFFFLRESSLCSSAAAVALSLTADFQLRLPSLKEGALPALMSLLNPPLSSSALSLSLSLSPSLAIQLAPARGQRPVRIATGRLCSCPLTAKGEGRQVVYVLNVTALTGILQDNDTRSLLFPVSRAWDGGGVCSVPFLHVHLSKEMILVPYPWSKPPPQPLQSLQVPFLVSP